jgi:hypothetical protein
VLKFTEIHFCQTQMALPLNEEQAELAPHFADEVQNDGSDEPRVWRHQLED